MTHDKCAAYGCSCLGHHQRKCQCFSNSGNGHNGISKFYVQHRKFVLDVWRTHHNDFSFCST